MSKVETGNGVSKSETSSQQVLMCSLQMQCHFKPAVMDRLTNLLSYPHWITMCFWAIHAYFVLPLLSKEYVWFHEFPALHANSFLVNTTQLLMFDVYE